MNSMRSALILLLVLASLPARADLTATVSRGKTFVEGERPTVDKLNALGMPIVTISGTIGGTNAGLAAGSIEGPHLSATVVDNATLYLNSTNAIAVATNGIGPVQLSTNAVGAGLTGGGGAAISLASAGINPTNLLYGPVALDGSTVTIDGHAGLTFTLTLTNDATLSFTNMVNGASYIVTVTQSTNGTNTATFSGVTWWNGTTPTLTQTTNKTDLFHFLSVGSAIYGAATQNF